MQEHADSSTADQTSGMPTKSLLADDLIAQLIQGKPESEVVTAFYHAIAGHASRKNFALAEQLRETMMEIFPNAVAEIVKAGEIIESEKASIIDFEKIKPWAELFDTFTLGEATAFYHLLNTMSARKHQRVFQQGDCDNRLFFIESGKLKWSCFDRQAKNNVVFANLTRGDICGVETFFTHTTHTTTLTVEEDAKLIVLDKKSYQQLLVDHSAIDSKLIAYCESHQKKLNIQNNGGLFRRAHPRFQTALMGKIYRVDPKENLSNQFLNVTIANISVGGLCCLVDKMGVGEAANLFQSNVQIFFSYMRYDTSHDMIIPAKAVAVRFFPLGESTVQLHFDKPLEESRVHEISFNTGITAYL
jgi:hypothetical protein